MSFAAGTKIDTIDGNIPIEKLPKTGMVKTYDGTYVLFTFAGCCGTEYTTILTLSDGGEIICTLDQMFLSNEDWVEAKDAMGMFLYDEDKEDVKESKDSKSVKDYEDYEDYGDSKDVKSSKEPTYIKSMRVGGKRQVYKIGVPTGDYCLSGGIIVAT
jgi:hypothetical protein